VAGVVVTGVSEGTSKVSLQGKTGPLATKEVTVTSQSTTNMLAVVGLDVAVLGGLGALAVGSTGPFARGSALEVTIGALQTKELSFEKDAMTVVASAVFEDHSRLELSTDSGLVLKSHNEDALTVVGSTVVVPFDAVSASGPILGVAWFPSGVCMNSSYAMSPYTQTNFSLDVTPPVAKEMLATVSNAFIVCTGDAATHTGADYPATTQLAVSLKFKTKTMSNLAGDSRVKYVVSDETLFTVDGKTGKVTANSNGNVGKASVRITFAGQPVSKVVEVEVTKLASITLKVTPYPAYSGSTSVSVARLSKIGCTGVYQSAVLGFVATLANGKSKALAGDIVSVTLDDTTTGFTVSGGSDRVVTPNAAGQSTVVAKFGPSGGQMESNKLDISSSNTLVTLKTIDGLRLGASLTTLAGVRHKQTAQLLASVTLSDDRKYTVAMGADGTPALPGLLRFTSSASAVIYVNAVKGTATLLDNHFEAVKLTAASSCADVSPSVSTTITMFANLEPVAADADVGARTGVPIPAQTTGSEFVVDVRVHTGSKTLQSFNVLVAYESDDLELVDTTNAVPSSQGSAEFKPGSSTGNTGLEALCAGAKLGTDCAIAVASITNSKVRGIATIFQIKFKVKSGAAATTRFSGIAEQLLDTSPWGGETIGVKTTVFDAGKIVVSITDGDRRRARRSAAAANTPPHRFRRTTSAGDLVLAKGDANCDGVFDLKDPAFILDYSSARAGDFKTTLGETMQGLVAACQTKNKLASTDTSFMDPDGNTEATLLDITYMLDILAGNFYFMQANPLAADSCTATFIVQMVTAQGEAVPVGTKVFLDFAMEENEALFAAMTASDALIALKNETTLTGALLEVSAIGDDQTIFSVELGFAFAMDSVGVQPSK
jgi:hypothetical protein